MIKDKLEFGKILEPLMKRFKPLSKEQADIYFDRLKYQDKGVLESAVTTLVDHAKAFPTPGEIREKCIQALKDRPELAQYKRRGCPNCHDGYVFYERIDREPYKMYVADCAHCHANEKSILPQMIQRDDRIFYACHKIRDNGIDCYRADPRTEEEYTAAQPVQTNAELRAYFLNT